jgi:ketosteroid isomerase-like protein
MIAVSCVDLDLSMRGVTMRGYQSALTLCAAGVMTACVTAPAVDVDTQIRRLEQQQAVAAIAGDRVTLERLFAPEFRVFNPSGAVADRNTLLNMLAGGTSPYRSATYATDTVRVYSGAVVSTGIETVVPAQGAQAGQNVQRRITHVWERRGGEWQLVLRHATVVVPPP